QLLLQRALRYTPMLYAHLPIMMDASGRKLSKSSAAPAVHAASGPAVLWQALTQLQQAPPAYLVGADIKDVWTWAHAHWSLEPLRGKRCVVVST
ncbi:MAG: tRNA glutamyl-Q(34) synthetase GluQRS, partial [Steroidobacteraceae bacterium]